MGRRGWEKGGGIGWDVWLPHTTGTDQEEDRILLTVCMPAKK